MKIIAPGYEVLDHLDQLGLAVRIEFCGRVCYKSEDRIDEHSAVPFVSKMAEHGHNSVLEMGVVTLEALCRSEESIHDFFLCQPKYLHIDRLEGGRLLITGSVRAFREMLMFHGRDGMVQALAAALAARHPYFFDAILPAGGLAAKGEISVRKVPLAEVDALAHPLQAKHRHIAVKFTVNRAVTHELVRHRPCAFLQESQRYCRYADDKFGNEVTFIQPMFWPEDSAEFSRWRQAMAETEKHYIDLLATSSPQAARTVLPNSCKTELIIYTNLAEWKHIFGQRTQKAAEPSMREVMIPLLKDFSARFPGQFT